MQATTHPRRRMDPAERRDLLRREGARLFGKNGYAATRLEDVATKAGVTKPMVYRHFESKRDLYLAILRRHEADLPTFIERVEPRGGAPADLVAAILDGWLDYVAENADAWLVIFRDRTGDPVIEGARRRVNQRATEVLAEFVRASAPGLEPELVEPTANLLSNGLAGLVLWWIDHPKVSRKTVHATATRACAAVLGR